MTCNKESALKQISEVNGERCNIPQVLDSLEITVSTIPTLNLYVFELVQNGLDVGAKKIKFTIDHDKIIFEHNGKSLGDTPDHVRGMSNLFQSTKGVESIGFMGFGFKTIYKRFKLVTVSDISGWKYTFNVGEEEVELAPDTFIYARKWLGAVTPYWNNEAPNPTTGFSTSFILEGATTSTKTLPLSYDIDNAFFEENEAAIGILAVKGLQELIIEDKTKNTKNSWILSYKLSEDDSNSNIARIEKIEHLSGDHDHSMGVVVDSVDEKVNQVKCWRVFSQRYVPDDEAVKSLCQSRLKNILALHGKEGAHRIWNLLKREHEMVGVVQLSDNSTNKFLASGDGGNVFATLPLGTKLAFDVNIQAEWLLDLSRRGLRDIDTNAWQKCLLLNTSGLIAKLIHYISILPQITQDKHVLLSSAFDILNFNPSRSNDINFLDKEWIDHFKKHIEDISFLPVITSNGVPELKKISEVYIMPKSTQKVPEHSKELFGRYVVDRSIVNDGFITFLLKSGLVPELTPDNLIEMWKTNGLKSWWETTGALRSPSDQYNLLFSVWVFLGTLFTPAVCSKLKCVLSSDGQTWITPVEVHVLDHPEEFKVHDVPLSSEQFYESANRILANHLPEKRLPPGWVKAIIEASGDWKGIGRKAFEWINSYWKKVSFKKILSDAMNNVNSRDEMKLDDDDHRHHYHDDVIRFTGWALLNRNSKTLITHLVAEQKNNSKRVIIPVNDAVMGSPYLEDSQSLATLSIFSSTPVIVDDYAKLDDKLSKSLLRDIFMELNCLGPLRLDEVVTEVIPVLPDYNQAKRGIATRLGKTLDEMEETHTTIASKWKMWDIKFPTELKQEAREYIASWLQTNIQILSNAKNCIYVEGYNRRSFYSYGTRGSAHWIKSLNNINWIHHSGEWKKPSDVTQSEASSVLSPLLVDVLFRQGIGFN
eukprot:TRINITY_DN897_c1_g1_i1.p1 TRINITY_DN897_c1_g1~~TRINITY_DN897_c1_g1_i1.p1  ORF type:complete len:932 (-),score=222.21 TRINITY_DN897_c1_g1_i1:45-2840(-)